MKKKWNIGWGLVSDCNMDCQFCYSRAKRNPKNDLVLEDWLNFIDTNHNYIGAINYGTGENTVSDDWYYLINYIRMNHPEIRQALTTNGYVSEVIKHDSNKLEIVNKSIDEIDVSLDFSDKEKHNEFRGQENAYNWAIETLSYCQKNKKYSTIVFLASKANMNTDNLSGIFEIAKKYNATIRVNLYRPTEGIDDFSRKFIVPPEELIAILRWIDKNHLILSISDALLSSLLTDSFEIDPSGCFSLRILPDGRITPSTYLIQDEFIVGTIKEKSVLYRLETDNSIDKIIYEQIPDECLGCRYVTYCKGGVYDRRYLWNRTLSIKDPYCLYVPGEPEWEKLSISNTSFTSVHHGYLPTMFFLPK